MLCGCSGTAALTTPYGLEWFNDHLQTGDEQPCITVWRAWHPFIVAVVMTQWWRLTWSRRDELPRAARWSPSGSWVWSRRRCTRPACWWCRRCCVPRHHAAPCRLARPTQSINHRRRFLQSHSIPFSCNQFTFLPRGQRIRGVCVMRSIIFYLLTYLLTSHSHSRAYD